MNISNLCSIVLESYLKYSFSYIKNEYFKSV